MAVDCVCCVLVVFLCDGTCVCVCVCVICVSDVYEFVSDVCALYVCVWSGCVCVWMCGVYGLMHVYFDVCV